MAINPLNNNADKDMGNIPSLTHTFSMNAQPQFSNKNVVSKTLGANAQPTKSHSTAHLKTDGTKAQSGAQVDQNRNATVDVKNNIKNDRHILNKQMDGVKAEVRECIGAAAKEAGVKPSEIHDHFAKSSPEIAMAVDIVAPMSVQISEALNEVRKGMKSLSSKQVSQIADRAATLYNDRKFKNDLNGAAPASNDLNGQDIKDIMSDGWQNDQQMKAMDAAEYAADQLHVGLQIIADDLDSGELTDTDPNALTMTDVELTSFDMHGSFNVASNPVQPDNAQTVQRRFGAVNANEMDSAFIQQFNGPPSMSA